MTAPHVPRSLPHTDRDRADIADRIRALLAEIDPDDEDADLIELLSDWPGDDGAAR